MAASVALSQIIAAPIAAALLKLDGVLGLSGWQWVFLGEGVPSVVLALCVPLLLPDGPEHMVQQGFAGLLSEAELDLLSSDVSAVAQVYHKQRHQAGSTFAHLKAGCCGGV